MKLPVRLSSAKELLQQSSEIIDEYFTSGQEYKDSLIAALNAQYQNLKIICESMLKALGYTGDLKTMESELTNNIKELQQRTFFMNGEALWELMLKDLSAAIPYDAKLQAQFSEYFHQKLLDLKIDKEIVDLDDSDKKLIGERILTELGFDTNGFTIVVGRDGSYIQGYGRKGSTPRVYLADIWVKQSKKIRERIQQQQILKNIKVEPQETGLQVIDELDPSTIYSLLRLKSEDIIGNDYMVYKAKEFLKNKLVEQQGPDDIFKQCVDEVFDKAREQDLFAGKNSPKKITGLIGEVQGLYFLRKIIKNNKSSASASWVATNSNGGAQPHTDLLLEFIGREYGIQIKNTTRALAENEITFQSFRSNLFNFARGQKLDSFLLGKSYDNIIEENNRPLYEAISTILMMESFNIPYRWVRKKGENGGGHAVRADIEDVPEFIGTRLAIEANAEQANKVVNIFASAMMFMQLQEDINMDLGGSNSLYIIGGSLAITSASIMLDIIKRLEEEILSFNMNVSYRKKDAKNPQTIVDFLNANKNNDKFYIQIHSSYNF